MRLLASREIGRARRRWSSTSMNLRKSLLMIVASSHGQTPSIFKMRMPRVHVSARWGQ